MNILFFVPYVPNLVRVRPFNFIRQLTSRGHEVTVVSIWSKEEELDDINNLKQFCHSIEAIHVPLWRSLWNSLVSIPTPHPLQASYSWQSNLANKLCNLTNHGNSEFKYDVLHIEHLRGVRYGIYLKSIKSQIPIVWDSVDCISHLFRQASQMSGRRINRWLAQFELHRTENFEAKLLDQFDHILVTSQIDRDAFSNLAPSNKKSSPITVMPNGVDLDYFEPCPDVEREPDTLVVTGKMSYHANISMVLYLVNAIMPRIWATHPYTNLWIVGKDPPNELKSLSSNPNILVTGTVEDIRPFLQKATIALAPLTYGAGIQNKVLEAMACSTPVVATPQAVTALNVRAGRDIIVSKEPVSFAKSVIDLLENPDYRDIVGRSGRKFVEENHNWGLITTQLEGIYYEVTHS
jgi:sugar transferase (PEP-CTERM/EpsH1 system associated)